jgi:hypothetical protein
LRGARAGRSAPSNAPKRTSGKLASWPHKRRVSIGTLPSLDEKKAKAVQAQSAKTEIEKTRQSVLQMLFSLRSERACFEQGTKTVFF